jgi:hypothetical protein
VFISCSALNTGLCVQCLCHSFASYFAVLVYVVFFQCLSVFLFCVLIMPIVPVMVPYLCPMFNMWFVYAKLLHPTTTDDGQLGQNM